MSATTTATTPGLLERLVALLVSFKLPTVAAEIVERFTKAGQPDALETLLEVLELEGDDRKERRTERLRRAAKLPPGKTFATFEDKHLPRPLVAKLRELATGAFVERAVNLLAFGLPGVGKSHAAAALGHALVEAGHSVLFVPTYQLVQELLAAKRDLQLPRALRKLDNFDVLILDDLAYVQRIGEEAEVLFTLIAERYERRATVITSNLVFSQWDQIFGNPMTTAAAVDRLVHHSVILEFRVPSYRTGRPRSARPVDEPSDGAAAQKQTEEGAP
jgi:DNA replication protein DnaC